MALDYSIIGERIRKARLENNITQEKLAEELDVSIAFVSRIECGTTHINLKRLSQICNILNIKGDILGRHTGLYNYTIGQRKGLGISYKAPLFVIGFNKERNEVIVGEQQELYRKEMKVNEVNLLLMDKIEKPLDVTVKIRYASKPAEAIINQTEAGNIQVIFKEPQRGITPGQSAVFYIGDVVVGGGKIQD